MGTRRDANVERYEDPGVLPVECDRSGCHALTYSQVECCGRLYARCDAHGGVDGAKRGRTAHRTLMCQSKAVR